MRQLFVIALFLILFALPALAQTEYPTPEEKEKTRQEAVRRQREAENRDLKAQQWPDGDLAVLKAMTAADIVKMQIFAADRTQRIVDQRRKELYQKRYLTFHFGTEHKTEVEAVLGLIKQAPKYKPPAMELALPPNRVLVVQPVKGEPFEFIYNSNLDAPFAGVYSRELKEALFALSEKTTRLSIIQLDGDKMLSTINTSAIPAHRGGSYSQTLRVELHLTPEKNLTLYLKLCDEEGILLMEDEQPAHYGEATVYTSRGPGQYIVLLHEP
jgi:hypothetical protein